MFYSQYILEKNIISAFHSYTHSLAVHSFGGQNEEHTFWGVGSETDILLPVALRRRI